MAAFSQYYLSFLIKLFTNVGVFFSDRFMTWVHFFGAIPEYLSDLSTSGSEFGVFGWIMFIIVTAINVALVFFVCYRIFQFIRRYFVFRAKEVEKDEILEELANAKNTITSLTIEKNQLYALRVKNLYGGLAVRDNAYPVATDFDPLLAGSAQQQVNSSNSSVSDSTAKATAGSSSRFHKLIDIDNSFINAPPFLSTAEADGVTLKQIVDGFVNFAASQLNLYYNHDIIRCFFAGMGTSHVLILQGISGTGKTSLPYAMGKYFSGNATIVSVQPSWRDRSDLLGYFNEFTKTYNETDFLASVYGSTYKEDPQFIILDEMNLARIEYYFAEFLSIMEMPDTSEWLVDVVSSSQDDDPKNLVDGKLLVPQNIWFVGTANQDDSTFTITDKVYDRTITIDISNRCEPFPSPVTASVNIPSNYMEHLYREAVRRHPLSKEGLANLKKIDEFIMQRFKITFGNRIMRQIKQFVPIYVDAGGTEVQAIDFILQSKILRKFTSLNLTFLIKEVNELIALFDKLFGKNSLKISIDYLKELIRGV